MEDMLKLPGGFRGWPIQWNHAKCCGADPCCHGNEILARRRDLVAYRLVYLCAASCVINDDDDDDIIVRLGQTVLR